MNCPEMNGFRCVFLLVFSLVFGGASCQHNARPAAAVLLPLYDIANQTQEDITTILGPQSSLNAADAKAAICANCQKYSYQNDRIVIEYTNDMADRITIRPSAGIKAEQVPALLGLPEAVPDFADKDKMQWTRYEGIREINAFLGEDGSVRLILVKVLTL